jgi:alpha-L-rhamnosidase
MLPPSLLRCEYLNDPLGIGLTPPRLSWEPPCDQSAYQVSISIRGECAWDSGRVESEETSGIPCGLASLVPLTLYEWRVRVWNPDGESSPWSGTAIFGTGPQGPGWTWIWPFDAGKKEGAEWIASPFDPVWQEKESLPALMLRREFSLPEKPARAVLFASALGVYEARINGSRVGDQVLAPEWTDYHRRVQYQAYDVAPLMEAGPNALGAMVGAGWYAGRIGMAENFSNAYRGIYGRRTGFIAWLHLEFADGRIEHVTTDRGWKASTDGPIRSADLLDGEVYDARLAFPDWDAPGFDDASWQAVACLKGPELCPQLNEPIRITRRLPAAALADRVTGSRVFDCGQNVAGWCSLRIRGAAAGQEIILRHGEMLNEDGSLYMDNMRGASPVDRYICRGDEEETYEPRFTYHGFRYVEISGLPERADSAEVTVCAVHSAAPDACEFSSSDPMLDRVVRAVQWTQRGNMHSVLTDCPQRDERLGWTGDAQVFSQTSIFNMDMAAFYTKWLRDVREAQAEDGRFPDIAPHPYDPNQRFSGNPGWGDCGVIVPWKAYVNYGDRRILEEMFEPACRYVEWSLRNNPDLIWKNCSQMTPIWYGDWLNADTFVDLPSIPKTGGEAPKPVYSTAFFAHAAERVGRMATVLGRKSEESRYLNLATDIRRAFNDAFVGEDGRIEGNTQAGYALALHFDLLPEALRPKAARHMVEALKPYGGALSTGIQSTIRLMLELSRYGYHKEAYAILMREDMPSWRYMIRNGGTTIWERWDGWVDGRGFQNPGMNSFNHYAIGAVGEWIYRVVGGINPDENAPGWKHFFVRPVPGGGLARASIGYRSIRGTIRSAWQIKDGVFSLEVTVPPNTTATIELPDGKIHPRMASGRHEFCATIPEGLP